MVELEKRHSIKSWTMHEDIRLVKQHFYDTHLPDVKPVGEHFTTAKQRLSRPTKRDASNFLPTIANSNLSDPSFDNNQLVSSSNQFETSTSSMKYNSAAHEVAKRYILRNNMAKLSRDVSSINANNNSYLKRKTLYDHIQPKINTGLPRVNGKNIRESDNYQIGTSHSIRWFALKTEIEQDMHIREKTKMLDFNTDGTHKKQLTELGNIVRSKVKSYLSSKIGRCAQRYKIVVHLTVFQRIPAGLHVASRCLWDTRTDNSITVKMQGTDCDILIVVFLCHTDVGGI